MKPFALLLAVAVLAGCAAHADEPAPTATDDADLDAVYERFSAGYAALDPEMVVALYTDDAYYLSGGDGAIRHGKDALRESFSFLTRRKEAGVQVTIDFNIVYRNVVEDVATDVGYYKITATRPDGQENVDVGKFVGVLHRGDDGQWRFQVDGYSGAPVEAFSVDPAQHHMDH